MERCIDCNRKLAAQYYDRRQGTLEQRQEQQSTLYVHIQYLRSQGYTLKKIADEVGLDKSTISYYLSGKRNVGMSAVRKSKKAKRG